MVDLHVIMAIPTNHQNTPEAKSYAPGLPRPYLVDIGLNLFDKNFSKTWEALLENSFAAGVGQAVLISTKPDTWKFNLDASSRYPDNLFTLIGIHPLSIQGIRDEDLSEMEQLVQTCAVGVGEVGLDFKYSEDKYPRDAQIRICEAQLQMAAKYKRPVMCHVRKAAPEFLELFSKYADKIPGAMINCFDGTEEELHHYLVLHSFPHLMIAETWNVHRHHRIGLQ